MYCFECVLKTQTDSTRKVVVVVVVVDIHIVYSVKGAFEHTSQVH